jgi:hypothetical protein
MSFYKWYEELVKVKQHYIENKFSHFEDLTVNQGRVKTLETADGNYVFASGKCEIIKAACDNMFNFKYEIEYAVKDRIVEYFDVNSKEWSQLGYLDRVDKDKSFNHIISNSTIAEINHDYLEFHLNKKVYTFPRLISSKFFGRVYLIY